MSRSSGPRSESALVVLCWLVRVLHPVCNHRLCPSRSDVDSDEEWSANTDSPIRRRGSCRLFLGLRCGAALSAAGQVSGKQTKKRLIEQRGRASYTAQRYSWSSEHHDDDDDEDEDEDEQDLRRRITITRKELRGRSYELTAQISGGRRLVLRTHRRGDCDPGKFLHRWPCIRVVLLKERKVP